MTYEESSTDRITRLLAGLLISAVALYLILRGVHWGEVRDAIGAADPAPIALATAIVVVMVAVRAFRWGILLNSAGGVRFWHLFASLNVGYLMNNVLPFQMGEVGRAYMLSELSGISTTRSLSAIVLERIVDILVLLVLLLFLAPFTPVPTALQLPAAALAVALLAVVTGLLMASRRRGFVLNVLEYLLRLAPMASRPKLRQMADNAIHGFDALTDPKVGLSAVAVSALGWLAMAAVVYLGMLAFGLDLGFEAALLVVIATTFGFFFPSSPGGIGVYHAIAIAILTGVYSVDKNLALSCVLVVHMVLYLPPILLATGVLWLERRIWRRTSIFAKLAELRGLEPAAAGQE